MGPRPAETSRRSSGYTKYYRRCYTRYNHVMSSLRVKKRKKWNSPTAPVSLTLFRRRGQTTGRHTMPRFALGVLALLWLGDPTLAQEARLLRFPAIHGGTIVFTYAGDLYTVAAKGGVARKLTNH